MTATLVRKELRALLPMTVLWWLILVIDPVSDLITSFPDQTPLWEGPSLLDSGSTMGAPGLLVSLWLALALLVRERDEGTLELLDSLPTSRLHIFLVKFATGLVILWCGPLLQLAVKLGLHVLSLDSISGGLHLDVLGRVFFLNAAQLFVWLSIAMLLAYLRRLAWVAAALLLFLYRFLDRHVGGLQELDVESLADVVFLGSEVVIPWHKLALQLPIAALCALVSGLVFCGGGQRALALGTRAVATWWGRGLAVLFTLSAIGLWIGLVADDSDDAPEPTKDAHGVVYEDWVTAHISAGRFSFSYPGKLAGRARFMIDHSEAVDTKVRDFFGADPVPGLQVDASGTGKSHHVRGRAFWKTVQLDLASLDEEELEPVLGHELTHVYIDVLSERKLLDDFNAMRFFHEGLAEYLEFRLFRDDDARRSHLLVALLVHDREPVTFELLADSERLAAERDHLLVYPLGRIFFEVLVSAEGVAAPARILAALARENAPEDLAGRELWRDGFQVAGLDLEAQVGRFGKYLDDLVEANRTLLATFPRLSALVSVEEDEDGDEWIVLLPRDVQEPPWPLVCRVRESVSDDVESYHHLHQNADGAFRLWRKHIAGKRFAYQLGFLDPATRAAAYERWTDAVLRP